MRPKCPTCEHELLRATNEGSGLLPSGEQGPVMVVMWICGTPTCHDPKE